MNLFKPSKQKRAEDLLSVGKKIAMDLGAQLTKGIPNDRHMMMVAEPFIMISTVQFYVMERLGGMTPQQMAPYKDEYVSTIVTRMMFMNPHLTEANAAEVMGSREYEYTKVLEENNLGTGEFFVQIVDVLVEYLCNMIIDGRVFIVPHVSLGLVKKAEVQSIVLNNLARILPKVIDLTAEMTKKRYFA